MKNEITDFLELRNQFDVRLQGCDNDCKEYKRTTSVEVSLIEQSGVNCTDPSQDDIRAGMAVAQDLVIAYCYIHLTAKTSAWL